MKLCTTLFLMFFKIGLTCFGGGYGMMSMIMEEGAKLVGLTPVEFADMAALDLVSSGPVAVNGATYVGFIKAGIPGAIAATLGVITPSVLVCVTAMFFVNRFRTSPIIRGLFRGITPACTGLLIYTCLTLFSEVFFDTELTTILSVSLTMNIGIMLLMFAAAVIAIFRFKADPVIVTVAGGILGLLLLS